MLLFPKKRRLADRFKDFVDIHCHIIPGIDDGAKNLYESFYLINRAMNMGITGFIATPHVLSDLYPNTPQTIANGYDEIKKYLEEKKITPSVFNVAAEYMVDSEFEKLLEDKNLLFLKDRYVLIELPFLQVPMNMERIIEQLTANNYIPVLAHPERYRYFHHQQFLLKNLKEMGCLLQLNALSLGNYYGKSIHKMAVDLVNSGYISFIGTDIHNQQHISKLEEVVLTKAIDHEISKIIENTKNTFGTV
ncbi:tyrosine-protein phosphatase [Galbibacter pacificus]|uniref:protein-tyrosine-phosphatase n=1 Tax=Galbibacter pacificus TaxID=2996052 RepID=A0ABT6FR89_9FLAO|nr:CpsB/CapC family capsule biosynthesis tyrosine phosphatase [Galbibacter pacificus]MDG3581745.1 histidinol phosphatase [Galbibacter pacificus]MDG3585781.1 histidinol phosphatase [Galbibacter pacificus]